MVVALMIIGANAVALAAPPAATIRQAQNVVQMARQQLPMQMANMILYEVSYDRSNYTLVYRYKFTVHVNRPSEAKIREAKQGLVAMLKAMPNSEDMQLITNGITFHYNYYNSDGTFLYAVKIRPSDVR